MQPTENRYQANLPQVSTSHHWSNQYTETDRGTEQISLKFAASHFTSLN